MKTALLLLTLATAIFAQDQDALRLGQMAKAESPLKDGQTNRAGCQEGEVKVELNNGVHSECRNYPKEHGPIQLRKRYFDENGKLRNEADQKLFDQRQAQGYPDGRYRNY